MLLGDIAEIKTGLVLSRKKADIEYAIQAKYPMVTLKNIADDGTFNDEQFEKFNSYEKLGEQYFTTEGDVLIRLSYPNTAIYINEKHVDLLVPSYFAIVKVQELMFLPEYVAWYLNTDAVKKELERSQAGTRILSTNKNVLKRIDIARIPIGKQQTLIKIKRLHEKEKKLYEKLVLEKEAYINSIMQSIIEKELEE